MNILIIKIVYSLSQVEIVIKLEQMKEFLGTHIHPEELTNLKDGEAVVLSGLKEAAVRGYTIVKDVSYRMRPEPGSPLFDVGAISLPFFPNWVFFSRSFLIG